MMPVKRVRKLTLAQKKAIRKYRNRPEIKIRIMEYQRDYRKRTKDKQKIYNQRHNEKYYNVAVKAIEDLKYYFGDMPGDCLEYLLRYFPDADRKDLAHAID